MHPVVKQWELQASCSIGWGSRLAKTGRHLREAIGTSSNLQSLADFGFSQGYLAICVFLQ